MLHATVLLPPQTPGSSSAGPGRATRTKGLFAQSQWIKGNLFSLGHYLPVVATMAQLESTQGGEMDKPRARSTPLTAPAKGQRFHQPAGPDSRPVFEEAGEGEGMGSAATRFLTLALNLVWTPRIHQQFQEHPSLASTSAPVFKLPKTLGLLNVTGPQAEGQQGKVNP